MQSIIKAFQVLDAFSVEKPELSFTEIVQATGLGRTNTHKILKKTLVLLNCLSQSHSGGPYRAGPKLFELGTLYLSQINLRRAAMPHLIQLANDFGGTAYLCIEDNGEALCLERVDGPSPIKVTVLQRGGRLPLHAGAAPLAITSCLDDEKIKEIVDQKGFNKLTVNTVQSYSELMAVINKTRREGIAISWEDVTIGVCSLGAPVFDSLGQMAGAVSIGGLLASFEGERMNAMIRLVKNTADNISAELGYVPDRTEINNG